jgi:hypothetical protein
MLDLLTTTEKVIYNGSKLSSVMVSELLLIIGISSGSYSKITYKFIHSHKSHTSAYKKFINTINIYSYI